jgi:hypothetical protein
MKYLPLTCLSLIFVATIANAAIAVREQDSGEQTIAYYKSQSDLIVVAEITSDVISMGSAPLDSRTLYPREYLFEINIEATLFGNPLKTKALHTSVSRIEAGYAPLASDLKKGAKFIFFLSHRAKEQPEWIAVDPWFGAMPYSPGLEAAITSKLNFSIN